MAVYILVAIIAYAIGSVNFSIIFSKKFAGFDVREKGSGNAGTTNMLRSVGKGLAALTLICDILKGVVAVLVAFWIGKIATNVKPEILVQLAGFFAVVGHTFPVYFGFKGGKGVATSAAAFMVALPIPFLITAVVFFGLKLFTKIVSIRSLSAGVTLFISTLLLGYDKYYVCATLFACILVFWRHKSNIVRLAKGQEK